MSVEEAKESRVFIEFLNWSIEHDDVVLRFSMLNVLLLYLCYTGGVISRYKQYISPSKNTSFNEKGSKGNQKFSHNMQRAA